MRVLILHHGSSSTSAQIGEAQRKIAADQRRALRFSAITQTGRWAGLIGA